jgi:streptomycin 6-kinase
MVDEASAWARDLPIHYESGGRPFEAELLSVAVDALREVDPAAAYLVNQDLHVGNILQAEREPWLVIDPKPAVGEREVSAVGLLRNAAVNGGAAAVRRWIDALVSLGLDRGRLLDWGTAHALAWRYDADGRWSEWSINIARVIYAAR